MKKRIKFAIIGCGRIAKNHKEAYSNHKNKLELVALCDIVETKAKDLCVDGASIYTDYKKMISEQKPGLVAICTESGKHAKIAIYCLEHKVNVIVEKPMALSIKDAKKMIEMAKKNKVTLCVSHQNRFNKAILKLREAIEGNRFGKIFYGTAAIRWCRNKDYYNQAKWRGTWEQDGGALMNQCIHNIDLLQWMMGSKVTEVMAYTKNQNHKYLEAEDLGLAILKFENGKYGEIEGTVNVYPENLEETLCIFGEKGTVRIGGKSVNKIDVWKFEDEEKDKKEIEKYKEEPPNVYGFGHMNLYGDMVEAIAENRKPLIDGEAGMRALEIVLAIYKSSKTGKAVKLPLVNFSTLNMVN